METQLKLALVIAGNFSGDEENTDPCTLLNYLPGPLAERCKFIEWSCQPSSHYSMQMMIEMSDMFETLIEDGYAGVIVISGSGVMEEMAYMADLLWQHSEPLIFANLMVQGRAGVEEGLMNLRCSVLAALSAGARDKGVMVCSSGELFAASDVVMVDPTSTDNTFQSPEKGSLGKLLGGGEKLISMLAGSRDIDGLVLAGFGTGNVSPTWVPHIRNAIRRRMPIVVVSRCFQGHVQDTNHFEGGYYRLMEMGVMSGGKLNPYQARIRMSLGLAAGLTEEGLKLYMLNQDVSEDSPVLYK